MSDNIVLRCEAINKTFVESARQTHVLDQINFTVKANESASIVGVSGSGKSTLLHILAGLDTATKGKVYLCGHDLATLNSKQKAQLRNQHIGFVYQFHHLLDEFSALENTAMPLLLNNKLSVKTITKKASYLLDRLGMLNRASHKPSELSGGERQRVAIARALINDPKLIFMDEPTGNLDSVTAKKIQQLIQELSVDNNRAFVIVTHDINFSKQMNSIWCLEKGYLKNLNEN